MAKKAGRARVSAAVLLAGVGAFLAVAAGNAQTWIDPTGTAAGSITLNGVAIPLSFSYANTQPGFLDTQSEDIRIILSEVALDAAARTDSITLGRLARQRGVHIVEVILDQEYRPLTGAIYATEFGGMVSVSGIHRFELSSSEHARVEGRLHTDGPREFMKVRYEYDVSFAAPIPRPPTPAEAAAALASPAGDAVRAYIAAVRANDLAAFRRTLGGDLLRQYDGAAGAAKFAALRRELPVAAEVVRVEGRSGGEVLAVIAGQTSGVALEFELTLARFAGVWLIIH